MEDLFLMQSVRGARLETRTSMKFLKMQYKKKENLGVIPNLFIFLVHLEVSKSRRVQKEEQNFVRKQEKQVYEATHL